MRAKVSDCSASHLSQCGAIPVTERHRSRTCLAPGYDAVLVLKTALEFSVTRLLLRVCVTADGLRASDCATECQRSVALVAEVPDRPPFWLWGLPGWLSARGD